MRLLHTSDWHLGALFHDQPRDADEADALDQVVKLAAAHQVDAVLIAGDVFDTANPGAEAQRRYYLTLRRLVEEAGVGAVAVIGGNHDNGLRLDGPRELLGALRLHVRGQWPRDADAADCVFPLLDRSGVERAVCAAVPYLREHDVRVVAAGEGAETAEVRQAAAVHGRLAAVREAAHARAGGLPVIVMAHCFATGGSLAGDERPSFAEVGGLGQLNLDHLAAGASYAALGHLHRPQAVGGHAHWRYSGSLLPNGFDEGLTQREVVLVDVPDAGGPAAVTRLPLVPWRTYGRLTGTPEEVQPLIAALPQSPGGDRRSWLDVGVRLDGPRPGLAAQVVGWAEQRGWLALKIVPLRSDASPEVWGAADELGGLAELTPEAVFERLYAHRFPGQQPDAALLTAFRELLAGVQGRG